MTLNLKHIITATLLILCSTAVPHASAQTLFAFEDNKIPPKVEAAYEAGLQFLVASQRSDGSRGSSQQAGITGLCLLSILAHGEDPAHGPYSAAVKKGLDSLLKAMNDSNGYIGTSMYNHGFATLALAEAYGTIQDPRLGPALKKAIDLILSAQKRNGHNAWRYSPDSSDADTTISGAQIVALIAARNAGIEVPDEALKKALQYLQSCQRADGSIGYTSQGSASAPRSAIGALVFALGKPEPTAPGKASFKNLKQFQDSVSTSSYFHYYLYYASQAYFHNSPKEWDEWNAKNINRVLRLQNRSDGSWQGAHGTEFATASTLLSLALNYRFLPIYERTGSGK